MSIIETENVFSGGTHAVARARIAPDAAPLTGSPFGVLVSAPHPGARAGSVPAESIYQWITAHRLVVLRGFAPLEGDAFPDYGRTLGRLIDWSVFGEVSEIEVRPAGYADNTLWTEQRVPFHWDHFEDQTPRLLVFRCDLAPPPGAGGETLFTDTARVLAAAPADVQKAWGAIRVRYRTSLEFSSSILGAHPFTGERVLRYIESKEDAAPDSPAGRLFADLQRRLYDPGACYAHSWREGDIVIADNNALLHGRNAFTPGASRRLRRVTVM